MIVVILLIPIIVSTFIFIYKKKDNKFTSIKEPIFLRILLQEGTVVDIRLMEQFLQSIHGTLDNSYIGSELSHFSFEIVAIGNKIFFVIVCSNSISNFISNQIYSYFPEAQIDKITDYLNLPDKEIDGIEIGLSKEFIFPIRTYDSWDIDPLTSVIGALSKLNDSKAFIQILAMPAKDSWQNKGKKYINALKSKKDDKGKRISLESGQGMEIKKIENKNLKSGFDFAIRVIVYDKNKSTRGRILNDILASFSQFKSPQLNSFSVKINSNNILKKIKQQVLKENDNSIFTKYKKRQLDVSNSNILSTDEIASIFHFPSKNLNIDSIAWIKSKKLPPPEGLPSAKDTQALFGLTDYRGIHIPFGIKKEDRRRHMYLVGKTGTGKSQLIKQLVLSDILAGEGVGLIDPHGDLVESILDLIPENRVEDVVYLDPSDTDFPVALNMLSLKEGESIELLTDGIVSVFIKLFGNSWGPRLQYILSNTIITLLHCQNVSLLAIQRILIDENYRKFLLKQVNDPFILRFWNDEYAKMAANPKLISEAISPIQNKVGRFLSSPMVRNMIGQVKSRINLADVMNDKKIFLVNLSQGKIGEENTALLGGLIVTRLYSNAMQRANMSIDQRKDFYLYVDEFQNFATSTFVKILSEARKYGLNLMVTHQYIDQIPESIQDAIFGNIGTLMNYVVGPKDAIRLSKEYAPHLTAEDLKNLDKFRMSLKLTIDGSQSQPFTAVAMLPRFNKTNMKEKIIQLSRDRYSSPKEEVERKLSKWANQKYSNTGTLIQ